MNRLVFLLAIAAAMPASATVTEETDKFTGEHRITYISDAKLEFAKPRISIRSGKINAVTFMYTPGLGRYAVQENMKFIGCKNIDWLIDGKPTQFGMVVHNFVRSDRITTELLSQEITASQLAAIGGATTVEYRLCGTVEGSLTTQDIAAAKEIAARLSAT